MEGECVCEYDNSNAKADSLPVSLWRVNMSTRFKTLKDLSAVAVECDIGRQIF